MDNVISLGDWKGKHNKDEDNIINLEEHKNNPDPEVIRIDTPATKEEIAGAFKNYLKRMHTVINMVGTTGEEEVDARLYDASEEYVMALYDETPDNINIREVAVQYEFLLSILDGYKLIPC